MQWLVIYLKGMAMGAADVVPGVSGGTIAFITGIYERLIDAIRAFDLDFLRLLMRGEWRQCWQRVDGGFLLALLAGIGTSIVMLAGLITWLLANEPVLVWAFFFGLIVASSIYIVRKIKQWNWIVGLLLLAGAAFAVAIGMARPAEVEVTSAYLFLCGSLAICAMILPGISGSFILVLLGAYSVVLQAVHQLDLPLLMLFMAGAAVGILVFSHVLGWLLHHYHDPMLAALTGFLIGSLYLIWPWKEVLRYYTSSSGMQKPLEQVNVLPQRFAEVSGQDPQVLACILLALGGIAVVLGLEKLSGLSGRQAG
jgi:putative membrane protein